MTQVQTKCSPIQIINIVTSQCNNICLQTYLLYTRNYKIISSQEKARSNQIHQNQMQLHYSFFIIQSPMYHQIQSSTNRGFYSQPQRQRDYSNNVLVSNNGCIYFLPAYLRIIFLEVEDINMHEMTAIFYTTLILNIYYKNLPEQFLQDLQQIEFSARSIQMVIFQGSGSGRNCMVRNNIDLHTMEYTFRGKLPLRLQCNVFLAPFELIDLKLLLTFHPKIKFKDGKLNILKINLMDVDDEQVKCSLQYIDSNVSGAYGLAQSSLWLDHRAVRDVHMKKYINDKSTNLDIEILQQRIIKERQTYKIPAGLIRRQRIYNWKFVVYQFKMYRYPLNTIVIVFIPLYILTFANLVVFWGLPEDVSNRLQTISGLMIVYGALVPQIRERIPPSPNITLLEILLYGLSFTIFLSTLQSLVAVIEFNEGGYTFVWSRNWRFLMAVCITICTFVVLVILTLLHKCVWEPRYNFRPEPAIGMDYDDYKIDTTIWYNNAASVYLRDKTRIVEPDSSKSDIQRVLNQNIFRPPSQNELPGDIVSILKQQHPQWFQERFSKCSKKGVDKSHEQRSRQRRRQKLNENYEHQNQEQDRSGNDYHNGPNTFPQQSNGHKRYLPYL